MDLFVSVILGTVLLNEGIVVNPSNSHRAFGMLIQPLCHIQDIDHSQLAGSNEDVFHLLFYHSCQASLKSIAF